MTSATTTKRPAKYSREMLEFELTALTTTFLPGSESWRDLRLPAPDTTINTPEGPAPAWKRKTVGDLLNQWLVEIGGRGSFLRIHPETFTLETVVVSYEKRGNSRRFGWVHRVNGVEVTP